MNSQIMDQNQYQNENQMSGDSQIPQDAQPGMVMNVKIREGIDQLPMYIKDPVIRKDGLMKGITKYVSYTMSGSGVSQDVNRRYSDFFALRERLLQRWPGVYIPNLPPKKIITSSQINTVETRVRLINVFCQKLSKFPFLMQSDEVKFFLGQNNEVAKSLEKMPIYRHYDILDRYRIAFTEYYDAYDLALGKQKVEEFGGFVKKILGYLQKFKGILSNFIRSREEEIKGYFSLISTFEDYEKCTLLEYTDGDDNKLVFFNSGNEELKNRVAELKIKLNNQYVDLFEWLEEECLDLTAMGEALTSFRNLNDTFNKFVKKKADTEQEMATVKFGKKTLGTLFKNKDVALNELEMTKNVLEEDIKTVDEIIKRSCYNLEMYIENYKNEKLLAYYEHLKTFARLQKSNNQTINTLWGTVGNDHNLK